MDVKRMHDMIETLTECAKYEFDKGVENIDTKEMGEVIDMIKDLAKAEYYRKISIAMDESEYGEDYDYMGAYEHERKGYRGQPRDSRGRYMSRRGRRGYEEPMYYTMTPEMYHMYPAEYYRDMDREMGKMYYTSGGSMGSSSSGMNSSSSTGGSRGYSENDGGQYSSRMQREGMNESRYDRARRGYEETKSMHNTGSAEDKKKAMESLENYMKELGEDMSELIGKMDANEKSMLRAKLQTLAQKVS